MKQHIRRLINFILIGMAMVYSAPIANSASMANVRIITDFIATFSSAEISKPTVDVSINKTTCAGITKPTLYQHPVEPNAPVSTITYNVDIPTAQGDERILFVTDIGISDKIDWLNPKFDGVRFSVRINGMTILNETVKEKGWIPVCTDISSFKGSKIKIEFMTHSIANAVYDWACWGHPRILFWSESSPFRDKVISLNSGVLSVFHEANQPLSLQFSTPNNTNQVQNWNYTPRSGNGIRCDIVDFNFEEGSTVSLNILSPSVVRSIFVGYYPFDIQLDYIRPSSALLYPNASVPLRCKVTNKGPGKLISSAATVTVYDGEHPVGNLNIPPLDIESSWIGEISWTTPNQIGSSSLMAILSINDYRNGINSKGTQNNGKKQIIPYQIISKNINDLALDSQTNIIRRSSWTASKLQGSYQLDNGNTRLVFERTNTGFNHAILYNKNGETWEQVAVWAPLIRVNLNTSNGPVVWEPSFTQINRGRNADASERYTNSWRLTCPANDPQGNQWYIELNVTLNNNSSEIDIQYTWSTTGAPFVYSLLGPNIYVGEGSFGGTKISGLFPGLEYLHGAESSSSTRDFAPEIADRRSPDSTKITMPLMAISYGTNNQPVLLNPDKFFCSDSIKTLWSAGDQPQKTIGLYWNIQQKWDGIHSMPTPRFSSPNNDEGMNNHRMALFLPSIPDLLIENQEYSYNWQLEPHKVYSLNAQLAVTDGPILSSVRHYLELNGGLPASSMRARSDAQERELCRKGFDTVWDGTNKWSHCVDWAAHFAPGFATLLLVDALSNSNSTEPSLEKRIEEVSNKYIDPMVKGMLEQDSFGSLLTSINNCHIMCWEFPFHYGYLETAINSLDNEIKGLISSQQTNGSWVFNPTGDQEKTLGKAGDGTMGIMAFNTMQLLRHARITGNPNSFEAGIKALEFLNKFSVPRGGQTWECPLYQPDMLPAAYAIEACVDAYRLTSDINYIQHAISWAETAIPFIYLWSLPDKPMMIGSTIPVFGSTFYTHTWLAVPVQWNGLVYSYHLLHLVETLESIANINSFPKGILEFSTQDWRTVIQLIYASATYQQCSEGNLIGTYPDSISNFEKRNGPFINPEDILVNLLALEGNDPDIHTTIWESIPMKRKTFSTAAKIITADTQKMTWELSYYKGNEIYAMISNIEAAPQKILVNGEELTEDTNSLQKNTGWHYSSESQRLFLNIPNPKGKVTLTIINS